MIFDRYVTVDWSANNRPKTGKDSIWICNLSADGEPDTAGLLPIPALTPNIW
jgi:hypothetical protein